MPAASVSAVATVGGGARIPLITQRLSEHLRAPVVTTHAPTAHRGRGRGADRHRSRVVDTATALTPTALRCCRRHRNDCDRWTPRSAAGVVRGRRQRGRAALQRRRPTPGPRCTSATRNGRTSSRRGVARCVLFGLSAVAAAIAAAVFGITLLSDTTTTPVEAATTSTTSPAPAAPATLPATPAPQAPQVTTVVVQQPAQRSYQAPQQPRTQAPVHASAAGTGDDASADVRDTTDNVRAADDDRSHAAADAAITTPDITQAAADRSRTGQWRHRHRDRHGDRHRWHWHGHRWNRQWRNRHGHQRNRRYRRRSGPRHTRARGTGGTTTAPKALVRAAFVAAFPREMQL